MVSHCLRIEVKDNPFNINFSLLAFWNFTLKIKLHKALKSNKQYLIYIIKVV